MVGYVALVVYTLTEQLTLRACLPRHRTMNPSHTWLQVIPGVMFLWWFANVGALAETLEKEYRARGASAHRPHQALGMAAGWLLVGVAALLILDYGLFVAVGTSQATGGNPSGDRRLAVAILVLAAMVLVAFFGLWIMYWVRIFLAWRSIGDVGPVKYDGLQIPVATDAQAPPRPAIRAETAAAPAPWPRIPALTSPRESVELPPLVRRSRQAGPVLDFCPNCGLMTAVDRACPRCGAPAARGGQA